MKGEKERERERERGEEKNHMKRRIRYVDLYFLCTIYLDPDISLSTPS